MSSHQCSLGKLAQRGASLRISPLATTMRSFYHTRSRPFVVQSMVQLNQWSKPAQPQPDNFERSGVRKIVGVKKTLVNQMQGMAPSLGPSKVAPYKIYGKSRLFSSSSNLHGRSQHQEQEEDEEEYSDQEELPPHSKASLSATQRRYNQASGFGKGMASQAARDISQSIQEELMVVDAETRDMLNCDPGRQAVRDYREQMTQRPRNLPADPMQGWKHPRPLKYLSNLSASGAGESSSTSSGSGAQPEGQEDRQMRPRRRQMVVSHTIRNREATTKAPPPLTQFSSGPRFEMYTSNAKEKMSEQRSELRPQTSWHRPKAAVEDKPEDLLIYREQMTQRPRNLPADPMQGWKHPRPLKYLSNLSASGAGESSSTSSGSGAQPEGQEDRQMRPRRRQMVVSHTIRNREATTKAPPPLTQFSSGPRFEMYTSNAKEKMSEQRSELRPQTSWHRPKAAVALTDQKLRFLQIRLCLY